MPLTSNEITNVLVGLGAAGAALTAWALGSYSQFRAARRKEDEADRKSMLESVKTNARIIAGLEARYARLKDKFDALNIDLKKNEEPKDQP